jgi:hypothetical protein
MFGILARLKAGNTIKADAALVADHSFRGHMRLGRQGLELSFDADVSHRLQARISLGNLDDFSGAVSAELDERIRAALAASGPMPSLVVLSPQDLNRLRQKAEEINSPINGASVLLIDPYVNYRGLILPKSSILPLALSPRSSNQEVSTMSTLKHDCAKAHAILQGRCDDPNDPISEIWVAGYLKAQGKLRTYYTLKAAGAVRPKTLPDCEIEKFAADYAGHAVKRHYGAMPGPEVSQLGDATLGVQPLYGQSEATNTILMLVYIAYGDVGDVVIRAAFDSDLPGISADLLAILSRHTTGGNEPQGQLRRVS